MRKKINFLILIMIFLGSSIASTFGQELPSATEKVEMDYSDRNKNFEGQMLHQIIGSEEDAKAKLANQLSPEQEITEREKQRLEKIDKQEKIMKIQEEKIKSQTNDTIPLMEFENVDINQYVINFTTMSSTIANGGSDTDFADDTAHFITKEGTYFAKMNYAKIIFETPSSESQVYLNIKISRINDIWLRVFKVFVNAVQKYSGYVGSGSNEFYISLGNIAAGDDVTLQINWGAFNDQAWLLEYAYMDPTWADQVAFSGQYFPKEWKSEIETKFIGGDDVRLSLDLDRVDDIYNRYLSIYVDGDLIVSEFVIGSSGYTGNEIDLGNYSRRTVHTLALRIRAGQYYEKGWRLNWLKIGYLALHVEVDWIEGWEPDMSVFNDVSDYYYENGYERINFFKDEELDFDEYVDEDELQDYYDEFAQINDPGSSHPDNHRYIVWGKYALDDEREDVAGFGIRFQKEGEEDTLYFKPFFFIAEYPINDAYAGDNSDINKQIAVVKHELGHTLTILIREDGEEYYDWGNRDSSVMNEISWWGTNSGDNAHYSFWGWVLDGKWWELRQGFYADDSEAFKLLNLIEV
ncbi:MAG: hypothetical protein GPJ54_12735 [Candidatus Heimdallarchaeota archaeon]|nr:hypothetical protein [Candidatus Heimdallarchaeota archaeon]